MKKFTLFCFCIGFFAFFSPLLGKNPSTPPLMYKSKKKVIAKKAVVSAAHPLATKVGLKILKQGGNAIDAAIATQFALAVVYPRAGNIGGGGFLVYRSGDGNEVTTLDFREKAPMNGSRNMFLDKSGNVMPRRSSRGQLAAGVPGTVDGCVKMFQKYSKLKDWNKLLQPAIDLAKKGFPITKLEALRLNENKKEFISHSSLPTALVKPNDKLWKRGDLLRQGVLAHTLELIRDKGEAGFYEGDTADKIVAEMAWGGGLITHEDLKKYEAVWRKPLMTQYRGHDVITMAPPSSGGIIMSQLFEFVETYPLSKMGFHSSESIHLIVEAERRAYADRAEHMGDADFYPVKVDKLMSRIYLKMRFADFNPEKATPSKDIKYGNLAYESDQTTHMSIVDTEGGAVSLTTTLNDNYGCRTVVGGAGFLLNNEMDDFSVKPGVPNIYGAIGGEANSIQAQKRPLSSMTPTIVTKNGKLFMVVGTPGGTTIPTSVFQVITNVIDFGMTAVQATQARRFHHQWMPDVISIEKGSMKPDLLAKLKGMGHAFAERPYIGLVETIVVRADGKLEGAADTRSDDSVEGF
jgi:gamma-glutamyltranspeptidase / glutathione hydrolase